MAEARVAKAVAAAKRKRDEIMASADKRQREMLLRKKNEQEQGDASFDDFLVRSADKEGYTVRNEAMSTTLEGGDDDEGMRKRMARRKESIPVLSAEEARHIMTASGALGGGAGSFQAQSSNLIDLRSSTSSQLQTSRSMPSAAVDPMESDPVSDLPPLARCPPIMYRSTSSTRGVKDSDEGDNDEEDQLIDLTPTTSTSTSSLVSMPTASFHSLQDEQEMHSPATLSSQSPVVTGTATDQIHPSTRLEESSNSWSTDDNPSSSAADILGSGEQAPGVPEEVADGERSDIDMMSDAGLMGMRTPESWTEVGSEVSDGDYAGR